MPCAENENISRNLGSREKLLEPAGRSFFVPLRADFAGRRTAALMQCISQLDVLLQDPEAVSASAAAGTMEENCSTPLSGLENNGAEEHASSWKNARIALCRRNCNHTNQKLSQEKAQTKSLETTGNSRLPDSSSKVLR